MTNEAVLQRKRDWNRRRGQEHKEVVNAMKAASGCLDCGSKADLQYHHRDPSTKRFTVGDGGTRAMSTILAEIDKCDVLCAGCHQRRHMAEDPDRNVRAGRAGGSAGRGKKRPWQTPAWYAARKAGLL